MRNVVICTIESSVSPLFYNSAIHESFSDQLVKHLTNRIRLIIIYIVMLFVLPGIPKVDELIQDDNEERKMNAVVVGADRLGNIPDVLATLGIHVQRHISGRASAHQRALAALPKNTQLLILLTDFLNHNAMKSYRSQAQVQGIPVIACKRSSSCLVQSVRRYLGLATACDVCAGTGMN